MIIWKYAVFNTILLTTEEQKKWLDEMGKHGWELIQVIPQKKETIFYFKRAEKTE